jgi:hypothetical protein
MAKGDSLLNERHAELELLLLWEGRVGNARVRDLYGLRITASSNLLRSLRGAYPDACTWDSVARAYKAAPGLKPAASSGQLEDYCRVIAREVGTPSGAASFRVRTDLTVVKPAVFSKLHMACQDGGAVEIGYASMTHPQRQDRIVLPRALVQVGRRWHLRAYCLRVNEYRDFALGRISTTKHAELDPMPAPGPDHGWQKEITLRLIPHPALSQEQQDVVRSEYMSTAAARRLIVRACLVPYVIQEIQAAVDLDTQLPPVYQLAIANAEDVRPWLFGDARTSRSVQR